MNLESLHSLKLFLNAGDKTLPAVSRFGQQLAGNGDACTTFSPIDGTSLAQFSDASSDQIDDAIAQAQTSFEMWRTVPAPKRGELVKAIGDIAREHKQLLADIITLECGKIVQESLGEVQEWIDICDFAVGLSRQLHGLTIASERPEHRMMEQWHPLGPIGVITAFNFPMAVWSWNAMLALVCGNTIIIKPSEKAPLCALACHRIVTLAQERCGIDIPALNQVILGRADAGAHIAASTAIPLVSATGSVPMGRKVASVVGARLGRSLLELGGNNACILTPDANLDLAIRGVVFSAVGTCGQRCTTMRRLIVHKSIAQEVKQRLVAAYQTLPIGDPSVNGTLIGPLIDQLSVDAMARALDNSVKEGGEILCGGVTADVPESLGGFYVKPAIVAMQAQTATVETETFAPILYVMEYDTLDEAIALQNDVPQGLSSSIFTNNLQEAELFLAATGSDCGIANVNIGTSGAEIGGAFGGEKETGGGRESGSDAWKNYMRRATNTINYGKELPLAQGIEF
jgi:aldehyde dehydrogenase (NAD+)